MGDICTKNHFYHMSLEWNLRSLLEDFVRLMHNSNQLCFELYMVYQHKRRQYIAHALQRQNMLLCQSLKNPQNMNLSYKHKNQGHIEHLLCPQVDHSMLANLLCNWNAQYDHLACHTYQRKN